MLQKFIVYLLLVQHLGSTLFCISWIFWSAVSNVSSLFEKAVTTKWKESIQTRFDCANAVIKRIFVFEKDSWNGTWRRRWTAIFAASLGSLSQTTLCTSTGSEWKTRERICIFPFAFPFPPPPPPIFHDIDPSFCTFWIILSNRNNDKLLKLDKRRRSRTFDWYKSRWIFNDIWECNIR